MSAPLFATFGTKLATAEECLFGHGQSSARCTSLCYTSVQICLDHNYIALSAILVDGIAMVDIQSDQKVSVHLVITIQIFTSNVQIVPRQSPDIY
jgi:hypothetical protein